MSDEEKADAPPATGPNAANNAAVTQIREVAKWLIAAFAAVGALLAGGSQLADLGSVSGWRLVAGIGAIPLVLGGVVWAILSAVEILMPKSISLKELAQGDAHEKFRTKVDSDPTLLMGFGNTIAGLQTEWERRRTAEVSAWEKYEGDEGDAKALKLAERASANRVSSDEEVSWLISFARYTETAELFRRILEKMTYAAIITAVGIGLFAWAAHPEDKDDESSEPVVVKLPTPITVDLNDAGIEALGKKLGAGCDPHALAAVALGGEEDALEVITLPSTTCTLQRFTLTDSLGTHVSTEAAVAPEAATGG